MNRVGRIYAMIGLMLLAAMLADCAWGTPALKIHVKPFDAQIFTLKDKHRDDPVTWHDCLLLEEEVRMDMIQENPSFEKLLAQGDFIIECVEVDTDGKEITDENND